MKGLVIFFLNSAQKQDELIEVFKVFKTDFKDDKFREEMISRFEKLKQFGRGMAELTGKAAARPGFNE